MVPPATMKDFWIKQPYYSAYLKTQGLKTAHGEQFYSGSQVNTVERGREALIITILLTSDTGSLLVCGKDTWMKKKENKLFSLPLFPEKTGKQLFTILTSKGFYSKLSSARNELTCTSSHNTEAELQEAYQQAWLLSFHVPSGLVSEQSNGSHCLPHTRVHAYIHTSEWCLSQLVSQHMLLYSPQE